MACVRGQPRHDDVDDRDALKDTENPERRHAELRRRIERVERQSETEQD
jgi:hypothetical protein